MVIRSPKRSISSLSEKCRWFRYYAGYTPGFVNDVLNQLELPHDAVILDPWNGAGTTTQVAIDRGCGALGFDINPVLVIVAKARILDSSVQGSLVTLANDILAKAAQSGPHSGAVSSDPLDAWLTPQSAAHFRNIESAIQKLLVDVPEYQVIFRSHSLQTLSSLACYFYVALFNTLRTFLNHFRASNPTWIKIPKTEGEQVNIDQEQIHQTYRKVAIEMAKVLQEIPVNVRPPQAKKYQIEVASSVSIPIENASVDAVISSPPYCTRIDYAMATRPELALLGCSASDDLKELRNKMIGTPTIDSRREISTEIPNSLWGETCSSFLKSVTNHTSKASESYYLKYFTQYFFLIHQSLIELNRVLKSKGICVLVVQDSYYKDIHNDLATIFTEICYELGWTLSHQVCFPVKRTLAGINRGTQKYRKTFGATESVLFFKKRK